MKFDKAYNLAMESNYGDDEFKPYKVRRGKEFAKALRKGGAIPSKSEKHKQPKNQRRWDWRNAVDNEEYNDKF